MRQSIDLVSYVTPIYITSAAVLTTTFALTGTPLTHYPAREYLPFLAIAVVPIIFGHTIYNWALRYVEAPVVSISLLGEPIGATILALLILKEVPSPLVLLEGAFTLIGIYLPPRSCSDH